jgi:hypothetical protein
VGAGSKKKHEIYAVAPTTPIASTVFTGAMLGMGGGGGVVAFGAVPADGVAAFEDAHELIDLVVAAPAGGPDSFAQFAGEVKAAHAALDAAASKGAPAHAIIEEHKALVAAGRAYLQGLSPDELYQLAADSGFEHPWLVGADTPPGKDHPLIFWLNPAYDQDIPSKLAIQDKAFARWQQLQAGGSYGGLAFGDYMAAHPAAGGIEVLSPAELVALHSELDDLRSQAKVGTDFYKTNAELWYAFHEGLHRYEQAVSSDPAFGKPVVSPWSWAPFSDAGLATVLSEHTNLSELDALALNRHGAQDYLWGSGESKAAAASRVAAWHQALEDIHSHVGQFGDIYGTDGLTLPSLSTPEGTVAVSCWLLDMAGLKADHGTGTVAAIAQKGSLWASDAAAELFGDSKLAARDATMRTAGMLGISTQTQFRGWAKDQKIGDLRALTVSLGMDEQTAKTSTRAQLQNFALGHISTKAKAAYETSLVAKAAAPAPTAPVVAATPMHQAPKTAPTAKPAAGSPASLPAGIVAKKAGFAEKRSQMAAGLQHLAAAMAATADRPTPGEVQNLKLTPTSAPVHGGAHSKQFFTDEKGRVWMFKPSVPARAAAEQAAADLFHRAGLPAVPVFAHKVSGKSGSLQPIVPHTGTVDPHPGSWSQGDVDAMVRFHVASWMVGDHDAKPDNMLRTPGGGILAIDQGQAWKFVGRDRLDVDYHPNSSYGVSPPVYHQAYKAAKSGKLAAGVKIRPEAAAPVIAAFESIGTTELRNMIRPVAEQGAAEQLPWYQPMRDSAKKRFKTADPTPAQIADAFVDHVVARKDRLRQDFAAFFAGLGVEGAEHLAEVAA